MRLWHSLLAGTAATVLCVSSVGLAPARAASAKPMYTYVVHPGVDARVTPAAGLPTWNFSFTYQGTSYTDTLIGNAPTGAASSVPIYIVPVQLNLGTAVYSATQTTPNGYSALTSTLHSPMFEKSIDYVQGGTDLGKTQYIDAFERGNLWSSVASNPGYHVLLGKPTIEPLSVLTVPSSKGKVKTEFGFKAATVDITWFDTQANTILKNLNIPSNAFTIFVTYNTYLTEVSGLICCIGGYHSYNGTQTYTQFSYIGVPGAFAQDVSALSHETGEWLNDPYTNNNSPCGILENGDPLENEANYGDYPYVAHGFTFHLQDLTYLPYFGAPTSTSVNNDVTFQGTPLTVCQNGS